MKILYLTCFFLLLGVFAQAQGTSGGDPEAARDKSNIYISNAFTPNDDGINDYWYVSTSSTFKDFSVKILDRWGIEIYSSEDPSFKWDGRMGGRPMPIGTYVYVLSGTTSQGQSVRRSGTVSLVR
jgi:gliding motility-associated-like protein